MIIRPSLRNRNVLSVGTQFDTLAAAAAVAAAGDVIWLEDGDIYTIAGNVTIPAGAHLMASDPAQVRVSGAGGVGLYLAGSNVVEGIDFNPSSLIVSGPGCVLRRNAIGNSQDLLSISFTAAGKVFVQHNLFYDMLYDGIRTNVGAQSIVNEVYIEDNDFVSDLADDDAGFVIGQQATPAVFLVVRRNNVNIKGVGARTFLQLQSTLNAARGQVITDHNRVKLETGAAADAIGLKMLASGVTQRLPVVTMLGDIVELLPGAGGTAYGATGPTLAGAVKDPSTLHLVDSNWADYAFTGFGGANQHTLIQTNDRVGVDAVAGAVVTLDLAVGQVCRWTAGENETVDLAGVQAAGMLLTVLIKNDAVAARTITFGAGFKSVASLVGTPGKTAILRFKSDGASMSLFSRTTGLS